MRFAIYARYSSDLQSERSIDDQIAACREHIAREDGDLVEVYSDYAQSGAHLDSRNGAVSLLRDAEKGRFDIVLTEALDRLSRDQEHIAGAYKRLSYRNVELRTLSEGRVDEMHIGLKGTMNALFLRDLAQKIRRGQRGRAQDGKNPGGKAYGYRVVRAFDEKGEVVRGQLEIDPEQAAVVRRIYTAYASGRSVSSIVKEFNAEGVPSPTGGLWNKSTITGSRSRKNGILHNERYVGVQVYNKQHAVKDPATGKRVFRVNPPSEWVVTEVPNLRILDDEIWNAAQSVNAGLKVQHKNAPRRRKRLLSGLLRCADCGGPMTIVTRNYWACSNNQNKATCDNHRKAPNDEVERRVFAGLKHKMVSSEMIEVFVEAYRQEYTDMQKRAAAKSRSLHRQLTKVTSQIDQAVAAVLNGLSSKAVNEKLEKLEAEKAVLTDQIAAAEGEQTKVVSLHPNLSKVYRTKLDELYRTLAESDSDPQIKHDAIQALRSLINHITVEFLPQRGKFDLNVDGALAGMMNVMDRNLTGSDTGTVKAYSLLRYHPYSTSPKTRFKA